MLRFRLTPVTARAKLVAPVIGLPPASTALDAQSANRALRRAFYDTATAATPAPGSPASSAVAGA